MDWNLVDVLTTPPPEKKYFLYFLRSMQAQLRLTMFKILVRAPGICFPLDGRICKFYAAIFDHWPVLHCLGLIRHRQQAIQLLLYYLLLLVTLRSCRKSPVHLDHIRSFFSCNKRKNYFAIVKKQNIRSVKTANKANSNLAEPSL